MHLKNYRFLIIVCLERQRINHVKSRRGYYLPPNGIEVSVLPMAHSDLQLQDFNKVMDDDLISNE